ncbi:TRAP-type mannitol/chloroaromatic compound transport system permease large subunit [Natronocella acetinitrilica]|uniref:TRAP-type mannitol/chloroaromatic compound transport system permease large subunit n=1 Tax=Natronocella acetinitrilica TaxID=414046 RepID=A0AAE3G1S7_9GAMM|nr:TRAP transporter large permease subunit [Natronocella acetinitrilica]MCP1673817.1 TRAP-type mannitol/chloroaromatic compound transport system permease large subunit [Natronocella acetinitrilica]
MNNTVKVGFSLLAIVVALVFGLFLSTENMTDGHVGLLMLGLVVTSIMLGFPAAFTLLGMGVLFGLYAFQWEWDIVMRLVVQRAWATVTNDVLVAIPLFIFMGYLVERANLIERLFKVMHLAMARVPGALGVATLATCALFATATGIIGAVVAVMGLLALPVMLKAGYNTKLAAGIVAAGGCLGILIPPSVLLIVYGATAGVSVVQLYAGAIFPGLMLASLYVVYVVVLSWLRPGLAPPLTAEQRAIPLPAFAKTAGNDERTPAISALLQALKGRRNANVALPSLLLYSAVLLTPAVLFVVALLFAYRQSDAAIGGFASAGSGFWLTSLVGGGLLALIYARLTIVRLEIARMLLSSVIPLAALIVAVLGSIVFGLATPTEAAAVGSMGGLLLALAYRRLNATMLKQSLYLTGKTTAMVGWLFIGASVFSAVFALLGGQQLIESWVLAMNLTPLEFMILAQVIIFVLGWPLDWTEIIVIFVPIFVPLLSHFDVNPLLFGLLVALNLQTAFLSPPVAMAAFYLRGVAPPEVTLNKIFVGMLPFLCIQILAIVILYTFPAVALWLPAQLYG